MRAVNLIPAGQRSGASVGAGRSQGGAYAVLALLANVGPTGDTTPVVVPVKAALRRRG